MKYVTIGGIAAVLYGVPRNTFDLDILIEATPENATKLLAALRDAGLGTASLITPDELLEQVVVVFNDHVRVDVQTSTPGLEFAAAWERREVITRADYNIVMVARDDLIASKRAAGREKDMEDVRMLEAGEGE